ncbi:putative TAF5-like RNA polymerase II [Apostichopus japonicus]|uniref:Putative TAF5-like RNA polymerase II n=1 Tax=Stichopus japonicus TaxID=307972 RepID=A0A2G8JP04_STIJA|nr:putative TAF5-like RNA polymerase II [Apostichopus japonicus]
MIKLCDRKEKYCAEQDSNLNLSLTGQWSVVCSVLLESLKLRLILRTKTGRTSFILCTTVKNGVSSASVPREEKEKGNSEGANHHHHPPGEVEDAFEDSSHLEQYAEELRKTLEGVRDGGSAAPSILLYTFLNAYQGLSCAKLSPRKELLVGGYEDSSLRMWSTGEEKRRVRRKAVDVSKVFLSGDCITPDVEEATESSPSECHALRGHSGPVYGCCYVPGSDLLLSCSEDTTIRGWRLSSATNAAIYRGHNYPVWDLDVSPSNFFFASASKDGTARLWTTERNFPLRVYAGHMMDVDCVKFHPNCKYMATGSNDKSIRLWDINEAKSVRLFTGHRSTVVSLAFSRTEISWHLQVALTTLYEFGTLGKTLPSRQKVRAATSQELVNNSQPSPFTYTASSSLSLTFSPRSVEPPTTR